MMHAWGITDIGLVRKENQDAYMIHETPVRTVCVVCDGMGGAAGGQLASHIATKTFMEEAEQVLTDKTADLDDFGRLLHQSWMLKKQTGSKISTGSIDELYQKAMEAGALGGKLLGAGGGGFLLFYVQEERQEAVMPRYFRWKR